MSFRCRNHSCRSLRTRVIYTGKRKGYIVARTLLCHDCGELSKFKRKEKPKPRTRTRAAR